MKLTRELYNQSGWIVRFYYDKITLYLFVTVESTIRHKRSLKDMINYTKASPINNEVVFNVSDFRICNNKVNVALSGAKGGLFNE